MWDIVWVSPQGHRSVSVSRHFLLQAPQCPCSVRKRFSRDHCCRGKWKPGCRIVGSHTRWELTTWADFQLCLHRLLMSTGCKSSHNGFLDVSSSNGGLRISEWIGQLSCLTIFFTSLSVAAFLRRAGRWRFNVGEHGTVSWECTAHSSSWQFAYCSCFWHICYCSTLTIDQFLTHCRQSLCKLKCQYGNSTILTVLASLIAQLSDGGTNGGPVTRPRPPLWSRHCVLVQQSYSRSGHDEMYQVPYARTNVYKYFFFPATVCNTLPSSLINSHSLQSFKTGVGVYNHHWLTWRDHWPQCVILGLLRDALYWKMNHHQHQFLYWTSLTWSAGWCWACFLCKVTWRIHWL